MASDAWLSRLMACFPNQKWTGDTLQTYMEAVEGCRLDDIQLATTRLVRGGWTSPFPPTPPAFRMLVDAAESDQRAKRQRDAAHQAEVDDAEGIAPPWHAKLWVAVYWRLTNLEPPRGLGLHDYLAIVDEHFLRPEDAGVRWSGGEKGGHLYTEVGARRPKVDEALEAARLVWEASGASSDHASVNREMVAGLVGAVK